MQGAEGTYQLGDVKLQRGGTLKHAKIFYKTFGALNAEKSKAILYPTWFTGFPENNEWLIGIGSFQVLHHHCVCLWQRLFVLTEQYSGAIQFRGDVVRQRGVSASFGHRIFRYFLTGAGRWMVDGCATDKWGCSNRSFLWLRQDSFT